MPGGERRDTDSETQAEERKGATSHTQDFGLNSGGERETTDAFRRGPVRPESLFPSVVPRPSHENNSGDEEKAVKTDSWGGDGRLDEVYMPLYVK